MKETILMRVLICKIHCPFMCFCKPSAAHLYTSRPLKLANTPQVIVPSSAYVDSAVCSESSSEAKEECVAEIKKPETSTVLKSCMRKLPRRPVSNEEAEKKRVQWMDELGQQLADIKEFESSDIEDTVNDEESNRCLCVIL